MNDIFDDYQVTLIEMITDALKEGNIEKLEGIQCFESAVDYTGIQGMESLINALIVETKQGYHEAKEIRKELATNWNECYARGETDRKQKEIDYLEKGYISIATIDNACNGLRRYLPMLDWLQSKGLIGGFAEYGGALTHLFLPKDLWGKILDKIMIEGSENEIFGSAMGKMLALAHSNRGFRSIVPLILGCNKANSKGEISSDVFLEECCTAISRPHRFYANMMERDNKKNKNIKAIIFSGDGVLLLNPNAVHVVKEWRRLAEQRAHSRSVGGE